MTGSEVMANPNTLPDRAAMGLPDSFAARSGPWPVHAHRDLLGLPADVLVGIAEDPGQSFERRCAAGYVLGLIGDPRVRGDDPRWRTSPPAVSGSAWIRARWAG